MILERCVAEESEEPLLCLQQPSGSLTGLGLNPAFFGLTPPSDTGADTMLTLQEEIRSIEREREGTGPRAPR
jgi:hypothetical protein